MQEYKNSLRPSPPYIIQYHGIVGDIIELTLWITKVVYVLICCQLQLTLFLKLIGQKRGRPFYDQTTAISKVAKITGQVSFHSKGPDTNKDRAKILKFND